MPFPPFAVEGKTACASEHGDLFFPTRYETKSGPAKALCWRCPVRRDCLEWVMEHESPNARVGVWAGTTPRERDERARKGRL